MTVSAIACGLLTLILIAVQKAPSGVRTPVEPAALAWLVALVLASVFASDPAASLIRLNKGLLPALVPLAAFHTLDRMRGRRAVGLLLFSAGLAALYGLFDFLGRGASFATRARGLVGHYMTFGGQLLLLSGIAAGVTLVARDRRWRIASGITLAILAVALATTYTRSAWIGFAVMIAVLVARTRPRWLPVLLACLLAAYALAPGDYRDRLHSAFDPHHPTNVERTYMWGAGLRIFRDHPLTGVGLQDLAPTYDRYRPPEAHERVGHLHNAVIQVAASMGVVGLIAFAWLIWALFRTTTAGLPWRVGGGSLSEAVRVGTFAALAGFMVAGLFEWNFGDEELLYLLYTMVGLAWGARHWKEDD